MVDDAPPSDMVLRIVTLGGHVTRAFTVNVDGKTGTVMDLKWIIRDAEGIEPDHQRLMTRNGISLTDDNKLLSEYGVMAGAELTLIIKLK